jgi:hypothetical protein
MSLLAGANDYVFEPVMRSQRFCNDVRFGSKADICAATTHVRFAPESGQRRAWSDAAWP